LATEGQGSAALYRKLKPGPGKSREQVESNQRKRIQGAMIELVARQGYAETTVRDLVRAAGVSKRAFYCHYPGRDCTGKEECLLDTYDMLVRRLASQVEAARKAGGDCRQQLRLGFGAFGAKLVERRKAAVLGLVEVLAAGPAARRRAGQTTVRLEAMVRDAFACEPGAVALPPELAKGIVAGAARVSRARILSGREDELPNLADELTAWTLSFRHEAIERLPAISAKQAPATLPPPTRRAPLPPGDDRSLILAATARIAAEEGYGALTVPRIRERAGVSRKRFDAQFEGVDDCFLATLDQELGAAIAAATAVLRKAPDWRQGVRGALRSICAAIARDTGLARLAFFEVVEAGRPGIHWRAELLGDLARAFRAGAPAGERPSELAGEASLGAAWSLIHYIVTRGRRHELLLVVDSLAFLLLAPACGAEASVAAIETSRAESSGCLPSDRNYFC